MQAASRDPVPSKPFRKMLLSRPVPASLTMEIERFRILALIAVSCVSLTGCHSAFDRFSSCGKRSHDSQATAASIFRGVNPAAAGPFDHCCLKRPQAAPYCQPGWGHHQTCWRQWPQGCGCNVYPPPASASARGFGHSYPQGLTPWAQAAPAPPGYYAPGTGGAWPGNIPPKVAPAPPAGSTWVAPAPPASPTPVEPPVLSAGSDWSIYPRAPQQVSAGAPAEVPVNPHNGIRKELRRSPMFHSVGRTRDSSSPIEANNRSNSTPDPRATTTTRVPPPVPPIPLNPDVVSVPLTQTADADARAGTNPTVTHAVPLRPRRVHRPLGRDADPIESPANRESELRARFVSTPLPPDFEPRQTGDLFSRCAPVPVFESYDIFIPEAGIPDFRVGQRAASSEAGPLVSKAHAPRSRRAMLNCGDPPRERMIFGAGAEF